MRQSKYALQLQGLLQILFFTASEAARHGIPRHALAFFVKKGVLERIYTGAYRSLNYIPKVDFEWENLAQAAASIPEGASV